MEEIDKRKFNIGFRLTNGENVFLHWLAKELHMSRGEVLRRGMIEYAKMMKCENALQWLDSRDRPDIELWRRWYEEYRKKETNK